MTKNPQRSLMYNKQRRWASADIPRGHPPSYTLQDPQCSLLGQLHNNTDDKT